MSEDKKTREPSQALARAEELLAFHEGSAEPKIAGGEPVVWINGEDFDEVLSDVRAALAQPADVAALVEAGEEVLKAIHAGEVPLKVQRIWNLSTALSKFEKEADPDGK